MRFQKAKIGLLSLFVLAGCASVDVNTPTPLEVYSKNRSEGYLEMALTYARKPPINWTQTDADAANQCKAWGFNGADSARPARTTCVGLYFRKCSKWRMKKKYQCTS